MPVTGGRAPLWTLKNQRRKEIIVIVLSTTD